VHVNVLMKGIAIVVKVKLVELLSQQRANYDSYLQIHLYSHGMHSGPQSIHLV